jgi:tRNA dimethylallyltransferase
MSALLAQSAAQRPPHHFLSLGLVPSERSVLHARIAERFDQMLAAGLEAELITLRQKYQLTPDLPSMRCVGYRQAWEAAEGISPHSELRDRGIFATRQLAKRQITWLSNTLECERFDCLDPNLNARLAERLGELLG